MNHVPNRLRGLVHPVILVSDHPRSVRYENDPPITASVGRAVLTGTDVVSSFFVWPERDFGGVVDGLPSSLLLLLFLHYLQTVSNRSQHSYFLCARDPPRLIQYSTLK